MKIRLTKPVVARNAEGEDAILLVGEEFVASPDREGRGAWIMASNDRKPFHVLVFTGEYEVVE